MRRREGESGLLAGVPFSTVPRSFDTHVEPHLFRVLLLRRLRLPLPPTAHLWRYRTPLATIAQRAPREGCWPDGGSQWRLLPPKCVEKQARGSHPTSWSAIWTCHCQRHGKIGCCGQRPSNLWEHAVGDRHDVLSVAGQKHTFGTP